MNYKIECKVKAVHQDGKGGLLVDIEPTARFRHQRPDVIKGNRPVDYALFIAHEYFSQSSDKNYGASLVRLGAIGVKLSLGLKKDGFDYVALAAAQATKGRVLLLVDETLQRIESVEMI